MSFPTVKTCPWKKGGRQRRRRFTLWPDAFWRRLVYQAKADLACKTVSRECADMIAAMNLELYGSRQTMPLRLTHAEAVVQCRGRKEPSP